LCNDVTTWSGRYYRVQEARFRPRPLQQPRPSFGIGARKPRMLRICALHGDVWNAGVSSLAEVAEMTELLAQQCRAVGRDPGQLRHSMYYMTSRLKPNPWSSKDAFEEVLGSYREVGIDEFIVDPAPVEQLDVMERVAGDLLPKLRVG